MTGWPDGIVPLPSKQCIGRINKQLDFCNGRKWEMFIRGFLCPCVGMHWVTLRVVLCLLSLHTKRCSTTMAQTTQIATSVTGRRNPTKSGRKRSRDFAYFDPSKSVAEGRKGALSRKQTPLTSQNRCVTRSATKRTQSVQNCMPTRSIGTIVS